VQKYMKDGDLEGKMQDTLNDAFSFTAPYQEKEIEGVSKGFFPTEKLMHTLSKNMCPSLQLEDGIRSDKASFMELDQKTS